MPMTNEATEGLFRRWARRKQEAKAAPDRVADAVPLPVSVPDQPAPDQPAPDLPSPVLPDVESLGADSDYTAFLQKGVAAEVQRIALQRAWASDKQIAGFRGMADYDWDFNAPTYGKLWASDDVAKLLQAVVSPPAEVEPDPVRPGPVEPAVAALVLPEVPQPMQETEPGLIAAGEHEAEPPRAAGPRHGSAMPS
jgi:hypothetical protein